MNVSEEAGRTIKHCSIFHHPKDKTEKTTIGNFGTLPSYGNPT